MCGGCWDSHAKMNNNRLLVTTEHEHTRRLSLSPSFRHLQSHLLTPWHTPTAFRPWFTNASKFLSSALLRRHVPGALHSPKWNIDIWVEGRSTHSTLPRGAHDLLSVSLVIWARGLCVCVFVFIILSVLCWFLCVGVYVFVCARAHTGFLVFLVQYALWLICRHCQCFW